MAVHLLISFSFNTAHSFIPDELVYYMMTESLAEGKLAIDSGYEEFPSPMFIFGLSVMHDGKVFPQYPVIYSALSLPFYLLADKQGLALVNQLAFVFVMFAVYVIQWKLFRSHFSAAAAALLTMCGGYFWIYSQAIAPHMLQVALIFAAAWCYVSAFMEPAKLGACRYLGCGLLLGLALGVRYDTLFALPLFFVPLLFVKPIRWRAVGLLLPGLLVSIGVLSLINQIKFGTYLPFTYSVGVGEGNASFRPLYLGIMAAGVLCLAAIWSGVRLGQAGKLPKPLYLVLAAIAALAGLVMAFPGLTMEFLIGFNRTVIDFSYLTDHPHLSQSMTRTPTGGVLALGEYKRSFLQSAPFVAVIALLAFQPKLKTTMREWGWICWLAMVPAVFLFFFSLLEWQGGFAYHMRYYTPTIPFFAMIAAQALTRFKASLFAEESASHWWVPTFAGAALVVAATFYAHYTEYPEREWWFLHFPLWLWAVLLVAAAIAFYDGAGLFMRQLAVMLVAITLFWGGATTLFVVYPHLNAYKRYLIRMSDSYEPYLEENAVIISVPRYFTNLVNREDKKIHVATIFKDGAKVTARDMYNLLAHNFAQGRATYVTHDIKSYSVLKHQVINWGVRLEEVRGEDKDTRTPAISQFILTGDRIRPVEEIEAGKE